jgi:hypothetical protein
MSVTYTIQGKLLRLDLVGEYEPQDVPRAFLAALNDPTCPDPAKLLVDVTGSLSLANRAPFQIRYVSEFLGPYADRIERRCAVVAAKDVHFGLGQMGAVFTQGVGVTAEIFRDVESALEWLGISSAEIAPREGTPE